MEKFSLTGFGGVCAAVLLMMASAAFAEDFVGLHHKTGYFADDPAMPVKWKQFPGGVSVNALQNYWRKTGGETFDIKLVCDWNVEGRITACEVVSETADNADITNEVIAILQEKAILM